MTKSPSYTRPESGKIAKQRGVVLFLALIALVAMSLAAVALTRSVDTSTLVAGNLAFKQSAITSGDSGLESAIAWVTSVTPATLQNDSPANAANGYYATASDALSLTADATWAVGSTAAPATGNGIDANGYEASSGNTTLYIIQRMCRNGGPPTAANCLFGAAAPNTGSKGVTDVTGAGALISSGLSPMYRITARITGPRNTVSYVQAFVY